MNELTAEFYRRHPGTGAWVREITPGEDVQVDGTLSVEELKTLLELLTEKK